MSNKDWTDDDVDMTVFEGKDIPAKSKIQLKPDSRLISYVEKGWLPKWAFWFVCVPGI